MRSPLWPWQQSSTRLCIRRAGGHAALRNPVGLDMPARVGHRNRIPAFTGFTRFTSNVNCVNQACTRTEADSSCFAGPLRELRPGGLYGGYGPLARGFSCPTLLSRGLLYRLKFAGYSGQCDRFGVHGGIRS